MLDAFLLRAALAGLGVALAAGLLGCFVVWRRMAYFGDATAHASILGVALALALGVPTTLGRRWRSRGRWRCWCSCSPDRGLAADTVLGVLAHGALGLGLFAVALTPGPRRGPRRLPVRGRADGGAGGPRADLGRRGAGGAAGLAELGAAPDLDAVARPRARRRGWTRGGARCSCRCCSRAWWRWRSRSWARSSSRRCS